MGISSFLICIGNDRLFNVSRLFDSSINNSSRIEERSLNEKRNILFENL